MLMTWQHAAAEAVRNLRNTEMTTDLALHERLGANADTWLGIADLLAEHGDIDIDDTIETP